MGLSAPRKGLCCERTLGCLGLHRAALGPGEPELGPKQVLNK